MASKGDIVRKVVVSLVTMGLLFGSQQSAAQQLSPTQLFYHYASKGNTYVLQQLKRTYSIDQEDESGNTALCQAIYRRDYPAFAVLENMGASTSHPCVEKIPFQTLQSFKYASASATGNIGAYQPKTYAPVAETEPTSWGAWIGGTALLAGAGAAVVAVAGGGGGGGGSKKDKDPDEPVQPDPEETCEGYPLDVCPENGTCIRCSLGDGVDHYALTGCVSGYTLSGNVCTAITCEAYPLTECPAHGICSNCQTGDGVSHYSLTNCDTGYNKSGNTCAPIRCEDYPLSSCPAHGVCTSCTSTDGKQHYILSSCETDYDKIGDTCQKKGSDYIYKSGSALTELKRTDANQYYFNGSASCESSTYRDAYIIKNTDTSRAQSANALSASNVKTNTTSSISLTQLSNGNAFGIYTSKTAFNARALGNYAETRGTISISKRNSDGSVNSGNVYGIHGSVAAINVYALDEASQANRAKKNAYGTISLTHVNGSGNMYGLHAGSNIAANAIKGGDASSTVTGAVTVTHSGAGAIYGVAGTYGYNAVVLPSLANTNISGSSSSTYTGSTNGLAKGTITMTNTAGSAGIVGVHGKSIAANGWKDILSKTKTTKYGKVEATINITQKGTGGVLGLRSAEGSAYNAFNNKGESVVSKITITGDSTEKKQTGTIYGVYSGGTDASYNSYLATVDSTVAASSSGLISIGTRDSSNNPVYISRNSGIIGASAESGSFRNAYSTTGTAPKASTNTGTINIFHTTPEGSNAVDISVVGIRTGKSAWNARATANSTKTSAKVTGSIELREKHLSAGKISVYGVLATGSFYNAYIGKGSVTSKNVLANVTGKIYVLNDNGTTETGSSHGIYSSSGTVWNAYSQDVTKGSVLGDIIVHGDNLPAYGIHTEKNAIYNAYNNLAGSTTVKGSVRMTGKNSMLGLYAKTGSVYNTYGPNTTGTIEVHKSGNVNSAAGASAMRSDGTGLVYNTNNSTATASVLLFYSGGNYGFGMRGPEVSSGPGKSTVTVIGIPILSADKKTASGKVYGMYADAKAENQKNGTITIDYIGPVFTTSDSSSSHSNVPETDNSAAYGMVGKTITNAGTITINRGAYKRTWPSEITWTPTSSYKKGTAYGIYATGGNGTVITNSGTITIANNFDHSYGIYVQDGTGTKITNSGTIEVKNSSTGYGIYIAKNGNSATVSNSGTIKVGTQTCKGTTNCAFDTGIVRQSSVDGSTSEENHFIHLNGATLVNSSLVESDTVLDLNSMDGVMGLSTGGSYAAPQLVGNLAVMDDVVTQGFETDYRLENAIVSEDTSKLNLYSNSALFEANLEGQDVVMSMKDFEEVTKDGSTAKFLSENYSKKNNESFFNALKEAKTKTMLSNTLDKMTGKTMLSRFSFEDMSMMRELNFDMNNNLFKMNNGHLSMAGSVSSPMAFKGDSGSNSRYTLSSKSDGVWTVGLGVAFTDIYSDNGHSENTRSDSMYQMIVPIGYKAGGFKLITSPRLGYARGSYDRTGYEDRTYDGTIEKRIFGLMNEARYPMIVGEWKLEPTAEFNMLGYEQKGHEKAKEYSLVIPKQRTYSVESGLGIYATREKELEKNKTIKMTAGLVAYHEFADPYKIDVGMHEMAGTFTLHDEKHSDNRVVARAGLNYDTDVYGIAASVISYIDRETKTNMNLGFKWKF